MVTEAGKELLRNTINTAKFHNRILEENVMWKQFELERGLTMMVSDDDILRRVKKHHHHQCSKHRKRDKSSYKRRSPDSKEIGRLSACSSKDVPDRWDHSGFQELYPEESCSEKTSSSPKTHPKKQKKRKRRHHSRCSASDTEIWEEFKMYKRRKTKREKSESISSGSDTHVKEWKKSHRKKGYEIDS